MTHAWSIEALAARLARGEQTSRSLVEACLSSVEQSGGAYVKVDAARARREADEADRLRARGIVASKIAGLPVSVKDLFDVEGEVTTAGSTLLAERPVAAADAVVVARLRAAGAIIMGRTHMSEFAFTGLGSNPHVPRCANPIDPERVPGGSSSGAAVSVARRQAVMGLGTDTGGSVRIPAAYCGLTGFKPTQSRVSRTGAFDLSPSLDSIGPIATTVACCAAVDAIIADRAPPSMPPRAVRGLRFAVPQDFVLDGMDAHVSRAFERALQRLRDAGGDIVSQRFPEFRRIPEIFAKGTIANAEAYALHKRLGLLDLPSGYDPRVLTRVEIGGRMTGFDLVELHRERQAMIESTARISRAFDGLVLPTVAIVAPQFRAIETPETFARANGLSLRNTNLFNFLDRCAISLPMQEEGDLGCGLMLVGEHLADAQLLALAAGVEMGLR